jgi:hypothetical protein
MESVKAAALAQITIIQMVWVVLPLNWAGYLKSGTYYVLMVVDKGEVVEEISGGVLNKITADAITIAT